MATDLRPVKSASAWHGAQFSSVDEFAVDLERRHLDEIGAVLAKILRAGLPYTSITKAQFPLPSLERDLTRCRQELTSGRGVVVIRGIPVDQHSVSELELVYWGIASHLGLAMSQSKLGDRLGHVTYDPERDEPWRGYRGNKPSGFHTDKDDIVSLFCVRPAKRGGETRLVSAVSIYNTLLENAPSLLTPLCEGYYMHWFAEPPPNTGPISDYRVPALARVGESVSAIWLPSYMVAAARELGESLPSDLAEAQTEFRRVADSDGFELRLPLQKGEAFFINNYEILHGRCGFEDWNDTAERRLLFRLWLKQNTQRPLPTGMIKYYRDLERAYVAPS